MKSYRVTRLFLSLVMLCLAIHPIASVAQSSSTSNLIPDALTPTEQQTAELNVREIPAKADADEQFVNEVIPRAQSMGEGVSLNKELTALSASIDHLNKNIRTTDFNKLPVQRLETLVEHWKFYGKQLESWRKKLQKLTLPISADAADLSQRKKYWLELRDNNSATLSPALLTRINELLAEINAAEAAISLPLGKLLELGQKGNVVSQKVEQGIDRSTQFVKNNDITLLKIDSPTLWEAWQSPEKMTDASIKQNLQVEFQYSQEYADAYSTRIAVMRAFNFLLLAVLMFISWKSKSAISAKSELAEYRNTLSRPFSAWFVLMAFSTMLFQDDLPLLIQQGILLLIWIPVLRLLPRKAFKLIGPWVYMSAVFYMMGMLAYILAANQLLFRLVLLATNVLMIATMLWLLRRSSSFIKVYSGIWLKIIKTGIVLGFIAIIVAMVCNIIGNVSMAEMLTQATIDSSYFALFLYTSISVLAGFLLFVFKSRAEKLLASSQHASSVIGLFVKAYKAVLLIYWLIAAMNMYRIWLPLSEMGKQIVDFNLSVGKFTISIGSLLLFPLTVYVAYWIAKTIRAVLNEDVFPNISLPRGVGNSVSSILYYTIIMAGFFIALAAAGFELSQLGMIISALSVGIGFGLQTVVNNFISGLILMLERPVQPGDTIEVSGTLGKVREIGMRATTLTTFEGADVVVPNGMLLSEKMINWTLSSDNRRVDIPIGVSYGSDPNMVLALLSDVAHATQGVSANPAPTVLFTGFGDSALNFSVRAWTTSYDDSVFIRSNMAVRILNALQEAGIDIPYPQRDLHLQSISPEILALIQKGKQHE
ncbi:MAG: mechanosensitive ion channel [Arenimonas sp.]|nr:mechanosensitive ion channel [Arenimonas sp.]